jgi:hypothetical protein
VDAAAAACAAKLIDRARNSARTREIRLVAYLSRKVGKPCVA